MLLRRKAECILQIYNGINAISKRMDVLFTGSVWVLLSELYPLGENIVFIRGPLHGDKR